MLQLLMLAFITHASNIVLCAIHNKLTNFLLPEIAKKQISFSLGKGAREQILKARDNRKSHRIQRDVPLLCWLHQRVWLCEVDTSQEYSPQNGSTPSFGKTLEKPVQEQHCDSQNTPDNFWDPWSTRQRCILSLVLFSIYMEHIM